MLSVHYHLDEFAIFHMYDTICQQHSKAKASVAASAIKREEIYIQLFDELFFLFEPLH